MPIMTGVLLTRESKEERSRRKNMKEEGVIGEDDRKAAVITRENKKVDPRCPNSSNPFHKCADYCFEKINASVHQERGKPGQRPV